MKYAIRTQLTFLITFVFLSLIFFFIITGAIALYLGLNEEIDRQLKIEEQQVTTLFETEFKDLLIEKGKRRQSLRDEFIEELNEIYSYKNQFVIFCLESNTGRRV